MKFTQITCNGNMNDCDDSVNLRNIKKVMRNISGLSKISELYEWPYENGVVRCYGNALGTAGQENKHDLPGSGKKMNNSLDNSDTQLLFNDIFLIRIENKKLVDFDISEYGLFYTLCFEGFDECNSDDVTSSEDDGESLDGFVVQDDILDDSGDSDESYELPDQVDGESNDGGDDDGGDDGGDDGEMDAETTESEMEDSDDIPYSEEGDEGEEDGEVEADGELDEDCNDY